MSNNQDDLIRILQNSEKELLELQKEPNQNDRFIAFLQKQNDDLRNTLTKTNPFFLEINREKLIPSQIGALRAVENHSFNQERM